MNVLYPLVFTARPLTLMPFIATMAVVVAVLCALCHARDRRYVRSTAFDVKHLTVPLVPALALLPFLSALGTSLFNVAGTSAGVVFTLLAVAAIIAVCGFTNAIPQRYYGLVILSIALALLLHNALVTDYLWGFDIQTEQNVAQFVVTNGVWGAPPHIDQDSLNLNAMLSITMLAPLLSIATGLSVTWVLKLLFPLLFALVPVALFRLYEKQSTHQIALFAAFYFMVTFSFYTELLAMARQEVAEFFFVALLFLLIDKQFHIGQRIVLFCTFGFALVVSHYSLTFIFLFCLILTWLVISAAKLINFSAFRRRAVHARIAVWLPTARLHGGIIALFALALFSLTMLWYRFANNPQPLITVSSVIKRTLLFVGIQAPKVQVTDQNTTKLVSALPSDASGVDTTGLQTVLVNQLPMHEVTKYLVLFALIVSIIGVVLAYRNRRQFLIAPEYFAFSLASIGILALCAYAPYFAASLNLSRFLHITQIVLGIFFVIGLSTLARTAVVFVRPSSRYDGASLARKALVCFMIVLFLFNVGLVYKAAGEITDSPTVFALDKRVDFSKFNTREIVAATWVGGANEGNYVYSDVFRYYAVFTSDEKHAQHLPIAGSWATLPLGSYVFLGTPNVNGGTFVMQSNDVTMTPTRLGVSYYTGGAHNVYSNGGAQVYAIAG